MIFSRDRGGRHAAAESRRDAKGSNTPGRGRRAASRSGASGRPSADSELRPAEAADRDPGRHESGRYDSGGRDSVLHESGARGPAPADDDAGPYDLADAPDGIERLDLGGLQIPVIEGVGVRVQANDAGVVQQVALVVSDSALVLSVLAAPRSEAIWDEVRADMRRELTGTGAPVQDLDGEYGPELRSHLPTPEGPIDVRLVGIDGPRWMVLATYQGRAAADPSAAGPLRDCLRGLVVDRGRDAMPVRDPLPLRLPREIAEQAKAQAAAQANQTINGVATADGAADA